MMVIRSIQPGRIRPPLIISSRAYRLYTYSRYDTPPPGKIDRASSRVASRRIASRRVARRVAPAISTCTIITY
eukprot:6136203-Pyramimonas_sp.AAC.1